MKYKYNGQWVDVNIKALDSMEIGCVIDYAGKEEKIPAGWLICDGSAISRTEYSELFDAIGTKWGTGDGSTTFNIPPAGIVRVGYDANDTDFNAVGKTGGEKAVQLTTDNLASNVISTTTTGSNADGYIMRGGYTASGTYNIGGSGVAHNNIQPYGTFYTIIKAKNTTPTMASVVNATNNSTTDAYSCDYENEHYGGVVLYENESGTTSNFSINDNRTNYKIIEIQYGNDSFFRTITRYYSQEVYVPLMCFYVASWGMQIQTCQFIIRGTSAQRDSDKFINCSTGDGSVSCGNATSPGIKIYKVIGYK